MHVFRLFAISVLLCTSQLFAFENPITVLRDTEIQVRVQHGVAAKNAKVGDRIMFLTDNPVLIGNEVVVPANAEVLGTITAVQKRSRASRRSLIQIRIHTLRWKDRQANLNAVIAGVLRGHPEANWDPWDKRTFLEGIRIAYHPDADASTDFWSDHNDVKIRGGVELILRQVDPLEFASQH